MKTLTEKYNAVLEGKFNKKQFVRDARLAHPQLITQYNGYDDTVAILKNRGYIFEELQKYKEEKISDYQYESSTEDVFSLEDIERGVDYELEKKGFNTVHRDFTEDDYEKAKTTVIKNLEKNRNYYLSLLSGESTKVQKNRKDVMKPAEKGEAVDKANGMIKADLNEGRRPKSKGGKVVKEDDYGNGGYVELMSADLDRGIKLIQKAWDDWKAGPMTEPGMIEYAKEDLIKHIHDSLTFFDEQDSIEEEEIQALQEKKTQLKESFKKLIVKVLTEDKKKVNEEVEEIKGHKVQHVQTVQDQDENFGESYVVFLIDDQFLVVFAVVVGKDVPGANHKGDNMEIAAKYWFPGEMVIGMKDGLEKYAKGPTSRAKMTVKRIFRELAQDADYHMGTSIPGDIKLDPEDYEYGSLDTIFEVTTEEKETEQKAFTLDGKVL